jgi:hypothetical protein
MNASRLHVSAPFPRVVVGAWVHGKGTYVVARGKSDLKTGGLVCDVGKKRDRSNHKSDFPEKE